MNKNTIFTAIAVFIIGFLIVSVFKGGSSQAGSDWQTAINWTEPSVSGDQIASANKPVYLFVTTEWCTFCKKMKGETFADSRVQENLNKYFTSIYLNPETPGKARFTGEEISYEELARKLGVTGYPANFFFNEKGELIGGQPGYLGADQFADLSRYIGGGFYKEYKFDEFMDLPQEHTTN